MLTYLLFKINLAFRVLSVLGVIQSLQVVLFFVFCFQVSPTFLVILTSVRIK